MNAKEVAAANLRRLMDYHKYSQTDVAKKAKVSQKHISDIINMRGKNGASITNLQDISERCFKIPIWHFLMPDCPDELLFDGQIEKLVDNFINNDHKGRNATISVSEIRARYEDH